MTIKYDQSANWLQEHGYTFDLTTSMGLEQLMAAAAAAALATASAAPVPVAVTQEVRARAPGKIILFGEHAVVHGTNAVAAAIDLCTNVHFSYLLPRNSGAGDGEGLIELEFKDVGLNFIWSTSRIEESIFTDASPPSPLSPGPCSPEKLLQIAGLVEEHGIPEDKIWLSSGVYAFLHLYTSIHGSMAGKVVVTSDLPVGSGLGSSAAYCVSLSAALLALSGAVDVNDQQSGWLQLKEEELELVNRWAFEGQKIIHGTPSGIDTTISTYGNMIKFSSGQLVRLHPYAGIRMLITDTKVGRNTKALVAGVAERGSRHPDAMGAVFTVVDSISNELSQIIEAPAIDEISITAKEEKIKELMEMNQGLLQCMGVNHAAIETVLEITLQYKLTSKLTGAGGGGCVLTLLPTLLSTVTIEKVVAELESCGYQCFEAEVGGKGLEICFK